MDLEREDTPAAGTTAAGAAEAVTPQSTGGAPTYASLPAMDEDQLRAYHNLPPATSARRLDFDDARLLALRIDPQHYVLQVSGTRPYANMDVVLVPLVYVRQPAHWQIEVVGTLSGIALPGVTPYAVSLPLGGFVGTRGIEVVGATRSQVFDLLGDPAPRPTPDPAPEPTPRGECGAWAAWLDRQPPGAGTLHVSGECDFPIGGFEVELSRHEPQGINPRDLLLDRVVRPPSDPATSHITRVQVRYHEDAPQGFDTVTIVPDGMTVTVEDVQ